jgi:hypothetical protein
MQTDKKKYQRILSLFLLYFVVYAISPLYRIAPVNLANEHAYIEQRKSVSLRNGEFFFLDIFFPNSTDREDADDSTSRLILFKKIKAVVQSLTDTKYKLANISGNVENPPAYEILPCIVREVRESTPKPYGNCLAVFSGLSPPSV